MEAIVSLKPDLVLAATINTPEQVKALEDLGLTVYVLSNPVTIDEMYKNLETVARITGHDQEAVKLIDSLKARVATVVDKANTAAEKPVVYYELDATDPNAPYTAGPGTFIDILISMAGGQNMGGKLDSSWAQISSEKLLELNPAIILLGDAAYGTTPESVIARTGWDVIDAVKNNRIYPFDDNLASRPGPRLVDGLETLAKLLHPELFK
jgi:iron complex transport system substrate-binding protein